MAQNTYKRNTQKENTAAQEEAPVEKKNNKSSEKKQQSSKVADSFFGFLNDRRFHLSVGFSVMALCVFTLLACISHVFSGNEDQSVVEGLLNTGVRESGKEVENLLGIVGAVISHYLIYKWFGLSFFLILPLLFSLGFKIVFDVFLLPIKSSLISILFLVFWLSLTLGYIILLSNQVANLGFLCGGIGYELAELFQGVLGWGTFLFLGLSLLVFAIFFFDIKNFNKTENILDNSETSEDDDVEPKSFKNRNNKANLAKSDTLQDSENEEYDDEEDDDSFSADDLVLQVKDESNGSVDSENILFKSEVLVDPKSKVPIKKPEFTFEMPNIEPEVASNVEVSQTNISAQESDIKVISQEFKRVPDEDVSDRVGAAIDDLEDYDPRLDLSAYRFPPLELMNEPPAGKVLINQDELKANSDKIVETLGNYQIGITKISATIGPTVTLYEIVPDPGVRISKIKNLEDDIALSLSALGIRIIAPMPGKGTIGIEVPNKNKEMVAIRSVLASDSFQKSDKALPVVLGKTISNEVFVIDLAAMPHLLMAGATGQGKSVGLNVLITSLIYRKHPSELKFVMVDPKKVELSLFSKLERHFLAKLPNNDEAIITDTKKVIYTLNSLCIEMDNRYDLLKKAGVRNLKEYNAKFVERKLKPTDGHKFLPYIVLIIDELADLMMTAGKEVETPIARLAQLARAIGIHLVVATQRPSVNVITGIIKANFPARLSFKVTSKIDSRTILDSGGADQLIGKGDMLLSQGSDIVRIQCAFVDTPEVDRVCDFIGEQRGYPTAYMLPEFSGDEDGGEKDAFDFSQRDPMFEEAARLIVQHQQGSTSLIQRKLSLGYNRSGRIIDQLEAAGIVGPFEGSKAREVYFHDLVSLEEHLRTLTGK
ncbi:MAG: DNA translocase FtsK [Cytophagales bacterium]